MTDHTDRVLSSIDAALEGWHGHDGTVSGDAMRWAPERPTSEQDHVPGYTAAHRYFDARGARADLVILDEPVRLHSVSANELREALTGRPVDPRPYDPQWVAVEAAEEARAFIDGIRAEREAVLDRWVAELTAEYAGRVRVVDQTSVGVLARYTQRHRARWRRDRWVLVMVHGRCKGDHVDVEVLGSWPWPTSDPG